MIVFAEEMRPFPDPLFFEVADALAKWRGVMADLTAAEAFIIVGEIEP
jgi:hypothetical protein